jgi:hypothetical protein
VIGPSSGYLVFLLSFLSLSVLKHALRIGGKGNEYQALCNHSHQPLGDL